MSKTYEVMVPATSANMGPGFDALGVAVNLRNISVVRESKFSSISIRGEGAKILKSKGNNIFLNIFNKQFFKLTGEERDFRFLFDNFIPISRGLGSSSAVIVSAIASAYYSAGVRVEKKQILEDALVYESHPDNITPAVYGGFCSAIVENSEVFHISHKMPKDLKAVVVIPDKAISTKASRTTLPERVSHVDAAYNLGRSSFLVASILSGNYDNLRYATKDKLHQPQRMEKMPILFEVQKTALNNGALMSTLSGSGSTFFNMVYEKDGKKLKDSLSNKFPNFRVELFEFDNNGVVIEEK